MTDRGTLLRIVGSFGEGGGQILRSSLALSMVTGIPFHMDRIRAGGRKPGLMRQHLTAVRAAETVSGAKVEGGETGSTSLTFEPGTVRPGDYTFSVGTAGSTTLVLQAVLPAFLTSSARSAPNAGGFMNRNEMLAIPVLLSVLTRPGKIFVELRDSDRVVGMLREMSLQLPQRRRGGSPSFDLARLGEADAWLLTINFFGMAKLRLGAEVKGGFLIISNIPWQQKTPFRGFRAGHLDGAVLQVTPGAGILQLPGLFTTAMEKDRRAAFQSAAHLYPLLLAGAGSPEAAQAWHFKLFGFRPVHPRPGRFDWKDSVVSSPRFGSVALQRQPSYDAGDTDFGLMRRVHDMRISMQLEDDGLRTRATWKLRKLP